MKALLIWLFFRQTFLPGNCCHADGELEAQSLLMLVSPGLSSLVFSQFRALVVHVNSNRVLPLQILNDTQTREDFPFCGSTSTPRSSKRSASWVNFVNPTLSNLK